MPAEIKIHYLHSHPLENAQILSLMPVSSSIKEMFLSYFESGMSPAVAISYHMSQLEMHPDFSEVDLADAAVNPLPTAVYYLHKQWRKENLGGHSTIDSVVKLKEKLKTYEDAGNMVRLTEHPFAVAIVTPIMQRAQSLLSASDICFVDSTGSCDAENHVITFMLISSHCGAVPVGVIITNGTSEDDYISGFSLMKETMGHSSFNGQQFPHVFMTDDSSAERNAIRRVWPESELKLCLFHVAQALWRWIWDSKHSILLDDRKQLMIEFRRVMYAVTEESAGEQMESAMHSDTAVQYQQYQEHLQTLWERRELWCLAWRRYSFMRGHHTNNFAEVTVRLYKDKVLSRCKAYNMVALVEFSLVVMESYYRHRLLSFAHSRIQRPYLFLEDLTKDATYLTPEVILFQANNLYRVPSEANGENAVFGDYYDVDTNLGLCSCPSGMFGRCCKHQLAVMLNFSEALPNTPIINASVRHQAAVLALGSAARSPEFYESTGVSETNIVTTGSSQLTQAEETIAAEIVAMETDDPTESASSCTETNSINISKQCDDICLLLKVKVQKLGSDTDASISSGLQKIFTKLSKVETSSQLSALLHSFGSNPSKHYRAGSAIRVQPTSIARRRDGITRGSRRVISGRPPKFRGACENMSKSKRPHSLIRNINCNVPNAKSH